MLPVVVKVVGGTLDTIYRLMKPCEFMGKKKDDHGKGGAGGSRIVGYQKRRGPVTRREEEEEMKWMCARKKF